VSASPTVPFWKALALGVCAMAIGPNLALSAAYQLHYSGLHSWLAFLGAALLAMLVAVALSRLASRFDVTPTILSYIKLTSTRSIAALVGATLLLGYVLGPADGVLAEAIYLTSLALPLTPHASEPWAQCVTVALSALFIGACAYRGLDVSARIATALGIACIPVAIWLTVASASSFHFDVRQELSLDGLSWEAILKGTFVAMAFFIGFDGVASLASETREPQRNVPRLLIPILVIAGVTLSVGTLLQTPTLLERSAALDAGESPTKIMAIAGGAPGLALAADVVLALAGMASLIGWLNISAMVVAAAARDGFLPAALGRNHPRYRSPRNAVMLLTVLSVILPIAMIAWTRSAPLTSTVNFTNVMVLLWLIPYAAVCVCALRLEFSPGACRTDRPS
jgi:amino acid transporter